MFKRRSLFALVTVSLTMLAIATAGTPAQAEGFSQINIWRSGHCLDNATQDDAKLQMWSCSGASEQKWLKTYNSDNGYFTLTNQRTGRCIAAPFWDPGPLTMRECDPADPSQQWLTYHEENTWAGWYYVWQNAGFGYCLTTPSVANGTIPQAIDCDPSDLYDWWQKP